MIKAYFSGLWRDRYILTSLIQRDLQLKYRRSMLGVAWSILTPLGLVLIIGTVYSIVFDSDPKVFIPTLFAGLNPWLFISAAADGGTAAFISAEGYLKQTTVNAQIFPIRVVAVAFVNLMYSILAFFVIYLFIAPGAFGPRMLMVIPGLALTALFSLALANFASVANTKVRDYQPLQSLVFQGLFYMTPIIFPASMLASKGFSFIYRVNPFYYFISLIRTPMIGLELPSLEEYLIASSVAIILFALSIVSVMRIKKGLALRL